MIKVKKEGHCIRYNHNILEYYSPQGKKHIFHRKNKKATMDEFIRFCEAYCEHLPSFPLTHVFVNIAGQLRPIWEHEETGLLVSGDRFYRVNPEIKEKRHVNFYDVRGRRFDSCRKLLKDLLCPGHTRENMELARTIFDENLKT